MAAHQALLSLGFSRQEHWSGLPFPSSMGKWKGRVKLLSCVRLFATPWTAAYQAPPSMGVSRQEYWSGPPVLSLTIWSILTNWVAWSTVTLLRYYRHHPCKFSSRKTDTLCPLNSNTPCPPYPQQPSFNFLSLWFDYSRGFMKVGSYRICTVTGLFHLV